MYGQAHSLEARIPSAVIWTITEVCNLRCTYCYTRFEDYRPVGPSKEVARALVKFCISQAELRTRTGIARPRREPAIHFFGGEPLTAFDVLKYTVELGEKLRPGAWRWSITTNGTLLSGDILKFFQRYNFGILLSLDGPEHVHDHHRVKVNGQGSFEDVMKAVRIIQKSGQSRRYEIRGTVTPETVKYLAESLAFLASLNFGSTVILPAYEQNWDDEALGLYEEGLTIWAGEWIRKFRRGEVLHFKQLEQGLKYLIGPRGSRRPCGLGDRVIGVGPRGRIRPCHRLATCRNFPQEWELGDVFTGVNLEKFAKSIQWDPSEIRSQADYDCSMCPLRFQCTSHCPATNWQMTGSRYVVAKAICDTELIHYKVAALVWGIMRHNSQFQSWIDKIGIRPGRTNRRKR